MWKHEVPHPLEYCKAVNDGSFFCGYTMSSSDDALDFGNGQIMPTATATTAGIVKFDGNGIAQWAKPTHAASFKHLAVSPDGTLMAITGAGARGTMNLLSRIDTSTGEVRAPVSIQGPLARLPLAQRSLTILTRARRSCGRTVAAAAGRTASAASRCTATAPK